MTIKEIIKKSYGEYYKYVENHVDEEGWTYVKDVAHLLDSYYEHNTGKDIEYQKSHGKSGSNPNWETRGARWRPKEISEYLNNQSR